MARNWQKPRLSFPGVTRGAFCVARASGSPRLVSVWVFVERPAPVRKTVLAAPPPVDRRVALFALEPADIFARLPCLRGAIDRHA
jgi:hypothetical protein